MPICCIFQKRLATDPQELKMLKRLFVQTGIHLAERVITILYSNGLYPASDMALIITSSELPV